MFKQKLLIVLIFFIFLACNCTNGKKTIQCWLQAPDLLPFIDRYNFSQENFKVEVYYFSSLPIELLSNEEKPDLIFAEYLSAAEIAPKLESLNSILNNGVISKNLFYKDLLQNHLFNNKLVVLPFSFHLPVIIFKNGVLKKGQDNSISLEELKEQSIKLNVYAKHKLLALGFAPVFNKDFFFLASNLFETNWQTHSQSILSWNDQALSSFLFFFQNWIEKNSFNLKSELAFIEYYLYEPPYKIIQEKQNEYIRLNSYLALENDILCLPPEKTKDLDFAWLAHNNKIAAADKVLFLAISKEAKNKNGAYDFLKWIYNPKNIEMIIKEQKEFEPCSFGVGKAFCALKQINEEVIAQMESRLKNKIPKEERLVFFKALPADWEKIKATLTTSWLFPFLEKDEKVKSIQEYLKK